MSVAAADPATATPDVFSVDLEDWYQGLEIDIDDWGRFEPRIRTGLDRLLDLLDAADTRATFFALGRQAELTPQLVRELARRGHEIASHGYSHRFVYRQSPTAFRAELRHSKALLEDLSGRPVVGYRAPFFSITADSLWALDVLAEERFAYDSSVFPVRNYRYGIAGAARAPGWVKTPAGHDLFEIPLSTVRPPLTGGRGPNVPLSGGGYFRLYPWALTRALIDRLHAEGSGLVFYVHPWEFDPDHPRVTMPRRFAHFTHYHALDSTFGKTRRLLDTYRFTTMEAAFAARMACPPSR